MNLARITLCSGDGHYVWSGTVTQFARDNGRFAARTVIAQFRAIASAGLNEPADFGGFEVLLEERA